MKYAQAQTALDLYRGFPEIMEKVDGFLTVAEVCSLLPAINILLFRLNDNF